MITLQIYTTHKPPPLKFFKQWIKNTFDALPNFPAYTDVTIRIVDEAESAHLNATFRKKKGPTNVLSFCDEPPPGFEKETLGDLVICAPLVLKEAEEQQKLPLAHWAHLTIHGTLHLLGYDHQTKGEVAAMESLEIHILKELGFENPYKEL